MQRWLLWVALFPVAHLGCAIFFENRQIHVQICIESSIICIAPFSFDNARASASAHQFRDLATLFDERFALDSRSAGAVKTGRGSARKSLSICKWNLCLRRMTQPREIAEKFAQEIKTLADEVRLKVHLGGLEARDLLEKLEPEVERIEREIASGGKVITDGVQSLVADGKALLARLTKHE
jgi:hypothetical protein